MFWDKQASKHIGPGEYDKVLGRHGREEKSKFTKDGAFELHVRGDVLEGRTLERIQDEDVSLGWSESGNLLLLHPDRREAAVSAPLESHREKLRHRQLGLSGGNHKPGEVVF